jgi:pimeloyl-ACP methyl ester carboxylesterase
MSVTVSETEPPPLLLLFVLSLPARPCLRLLTGQRVPVPGWRVLAARLPLAENIVILSGTNGASYLYSSIVEKLRTRGFCTLVFDPRAHGRSENAPGRLTAELLGEDAAHIIRHVFAGEPTHILGWSLGGALGYYLAIEHPELVKSLTVSGMTSCFGRPLLPDLSCDPSYSAGWLSTIGALPLPAQLLGTELQGQIAALPFLFAQQTTDAVMKFFRFQDTSAFTRTPAVWGQWNYERYHKDLRSQCMMHARYRAFASFVCQPCFKF